MHRMTVVPNDVALALDGFAEEETQAHEIKEMALEVLEEEAESPIMAEVVTDMDINESDAETACHGVIRLQARVRGAQVRDHELPYASEAYSNEEEDYGYDDRSSVYNEQNTDFPIFNATYLPVEDIEMTDKQFKLEVMVPLLREMDFRLTLGNGVYCAQGHVACDCEDRDVDQDMAIVGMLKRATYAFLAKELA
jgi:hypothetical protein